MMRNVKIVDSSNIIIDLEKDYSNEDTADLMEVDLNDSKKEEVDHSFDELVKAFGEDCICRR